MSTTQIRRMKRFLIFLISVVRRKSLLQPAGVHVGSATLQSQVGDGALARLTKRSLGRFSPGSVFDGPLRSEAPARNPH